MSLSVVINGQVTITRCLEKTHLHFVHSSNCVYAKNKRDQRRISYPRQALMVDPYIIIAWSAIDFIAALFHFAVFFLICTLCLSGGASKKLEIKWRSAKNHPQYNKMQTPCHPSVIELLHIQCQCRKNCNELKGAKVVSRHLRFCHIALCAFPPINHHGALIYGLKVHPRALSTQRKTVDSIIIMVRVFGPLASLVRE